MPVRVVDSLEAVDVHQEQAERVAVALVVVDQVRELALKHPEVAEAGQRVRVRLRLELARARLNVCLHRLGLDRRDRLDQLLDRLGEPLGVVGKVLAQRVEQHRLKRPDIARHVGRSRLAPAAAQGRERGRALGLLLRQVVRVALGLGDRADDAADQLGQLAGDLLGGKLADLVERRALDQSDEPLLRELVA